MNGLQDCLYLGNLSAKRDWGYAGDYVDAMWRMLQHDEPSDYVVATGETRTVRDFATRAFARANVPLEWEGEGADEIGRHARNGSVLVRVDPRYFRPAEVELLLGDPTKAKAVLGWQPKVGFEALVDMMTDADLALAEKEARLR